MAKRWRYQDHPNADDIIVQQCNRVLRSILKSPSGESIKHIKDTRSIHKTIFEQLVDDDQKHFAGHYRGDDYPDLVDRIGSRQIELFPGLFVKHRFTKPKNVTTEIDNLKHSIDYLYANRNEIEKQHYYSIAVEVLTRFYLIHPYVNGNGHIGRVIMTYLMRIAGIEIDGSWTIHPRPYTNAIAVCMFTHSKYSIIAEQYFRQWFHVSNNNVSTINRDTDLCDPDFFTPSCDDSDSCSDEPSHEDSDSDSRTPPYDDSDSGSDEPSHEDSDSDSRVQNSGRSSSTTVYFEYTGINRKR